MQKIGRHDNGDRRLTVAAVSNEGVQLIVKWRGLVDHCFIAGQAMAKKNLAWVFRRCSGISGKHQMMHHCPVTSCLDDLVRESCWRDALGV
jgi:hypothetical protein